MKTEKGPHTAHPGPQTYDGLSLAVDDFDRTCIRQCSISFVPAYTTVCHPVSRRRAPCVVHMSNTCSTRSNQEGWYGLLAHLFWH